MVVCPYSRQTMTPRPPRNLRITSTTWRSTATSKSNQLYGLTVKECEICSDKRRQRTSGSKCQLITNRLENGTSRLPTSYARSSRRDILTTRRKSSTTPWPLRPARIYWEKSPFLSDHPEDLVACRYRGMTLSRDLASTHERAVVRKENGILHLILATTVPGHVLHYQILLHQQLQVVSLLLHRHLRHSCRGTRPSSTARCFRRRLQTLAVSDQAL